MIGMSLMGFAPQAFAEPYGQVVGYYSNGKLIHSTALPEKGGGFVNLFRSRNHFWGSQGLVEIIQWAAADILHRFPQGERLQVGDLSKELGGVIERHGSHQNGLDVDFVYFRNNHREQDLNSKRGFEEEFVINGKLSKNFDLLRNWTFFKLLVSTGRINRMFVDPTIKEAFCDYARKYESTRQAAETLRRLRPYEKHADHVHVRLSCPNSSPECVQQPEPEPGSGCARHGALLSIESLESID